MCTLKVIGGSMIWGKWWAKQTKLFFYKNIDKFVHSSIVAYKTIKVGNINKGTHMALHYMLRGLRKIILDTPIDLPTNMEMLVKDGWGNQGVEKKNCLCHL
jgi:hypothetical protein